MYSMKLTFIQKNIIKLSEKTDVIDFIKLPRK